MKKAESARFFLRRADDHPYRSYRFLCVSLKRMFLFFDGLFLLFFAIPILKMIFVSKPLILMESFFNPEVTASIVLPLYAALIVNIIAILSPTLINHTLEDLLPLCPQKSYKMPQRPANPATDTPFCCSIDIISGNQVTGTNPALTYIEQGANFRQIKRSGAIIDSQHGETGIKNAFGMSLPSCRTYLCSM